MAGEHEATEAAMRAARLDLAKRPTDMPAGKWYAEEVDRLLADGHATSVTKAAAIVAEANGVSTGNVIAQRGQYRRDQGIRPPREQHRRATGHHAQPVVETPVPMIDAVDDFQKALALLQTTSKALVKAAKATEQAANDKTERAANETLRKLKEAMSTLG